MPKISNDEFAEAINQMDLEDAESSPDNYDVEALLEFNEREHRRACGMPDRLAQLIPCPHCGSNDEQTIGTGGCYYMWNAYCSNCGYGVEANDPDAAVKYFNWNTTEHMNRGEW